MILIDPITIAIGACVSGLILLSVNGIRLLKGIPPRTSTTVVGVIAVVWGTLDQACILLRLQFGLSFALLLIGIGIAVLLAPFLSRSNIQPAGHSVDV